LILTRPPAVTEFPDASTFAAVAADPRFLAALAIAFLAGGVRGFSGFGSALTYIPLMSAVFEPRIAAATFLVIDFATGVTFAYAVRHLATWREILPLAAAAIVAAQFGALILQYADATALRWLISLLVLLVVAVLASGWRYHGRPRLAVTIAVGLLAGLIGGAVQISGPPVILFWLGSAAGIAVARANFIMYFTLFAAASILTYALHGLMTASVLALGLMIVPLHILGMWLGSRLFRLASEKVYRRTGYAITLASAILGMPLLDRWLR
jgi:uncharacterized protein